jgi:transposase
MPEQRRRFSPQFKAEAVQMVLETGRPIAEVARDLGINEGTLGNWVNIWRRENPEPTTELTPMERARVKEVEADICRLRMENEFGKKQRPSSRGHSRSRALRCARCGEGQLSDRVDVPAVGRAAVEFLRLDPPGRDPDPGPPAGAGGRGGQGVRRLPADLGLPADHRRAQPPRHRGLGRAGRRPDARAGPGGGAAAGPTSAPRCPGTRR